MLGSGITVYWLYTSVAWFNSDRQVFQSISHVMIETEVLDASIYCVKGC